MSGVTFNDLHGPRLVFAFGSNMSRAQMRKRCPRSVFVGSGKLDGYRLAFRGWSRGWRGAVATAVKAKGRKLPGALYVVSLSDLFALDRFEGHPFAYRRVVREVQLGSATVKAWVYIKTNGAFGPPSDRYLGVISRAYDRFRFDKRLLIGSLVYSRERMYAEVEDDQPWWQTYRAG